MPRSPKGRGLKSQTRPWGWGLAFRVFWFRVWGLGLIGFRVSWFRVWGLGFRGFWFRENVSKNDGEAPT